MVCFSPSPSITFIISLSFYIILHIIYCNSSVNEIKLNSSALDESCYLHRSVFHTQTANTCSLKVLGKVSLVWSLLACGKPQRVVRVAVQCVSEEPVDMMRHWNASVSSLWSHGTTVVGQIWKSERYCQSSSSRVAFILYCCQHFRILRNVLFLDKSYCLPSIVVYVLPNAVPLHGIRPSVWVCAGMCL